MQTFIIDEPLPFKIHEGTTMEYSTSGITFFINMPNLSDVEIASARNGKVEACLYINQPVIFMLLKITGCVDWSDAPYSVHLSRSNLDISHVFTQEEGMAIFIVLNDSQKNVVKALRLISAGTEFSNIFIKAVKDQSDKPFNKSLYDLSIAETQKNLTCDDMVLRGHGYFRIRKQ